jgi:uncharacterized protein
MKKMDVHCHTTNRKVNRTLPESAFLDEILKQAEKYDIETTVVLATYFPHTKSGISNFRLFHWVQSYEYPDDSLMPDPFVMFASLDFEHYFFQGINEIRELAYDYRVKGIKIYTNYQKIDVKSNEMKQVVDAAKENLLPIMFHTGYSHSSMLRYGRPVIANLVLPSDLEFIAAENPEINIIISHLANPFLDDLIGVVNRNGNVYSDMSGLLNSKHEKHELPECVDVIKKFLDNCSHKKLLFGTDFPIQTHEDSIEMIEQSMKNHSEAEKEDVYYNTAREIIFKGRRQWEK